ncbi:DUF4252 domain-containing protein [Aestuariibaculum suncheonense]|uniref:DUF4252 domain-containing protein n=1 Tax=Aestuariibaculum suncheonense TaxID=1028745 RepID=A0A8J6UAR3_9FLAO|nr:DUF4252 domain-containing protein [Aestuariibaculum suncheonense]MBD0834692.1 DUF4252 domain-containing protein [Aestuariibaculum suncheonense]
MKRTVHYIITGCMAALILVSCGNTPSLQSYFVDHQETASFISQDIPISMLNIDTSNFTEDQKEAYNSVSRLNFLGYKSDSTNIDAYTDEVNKVKAILNDEKYQDLMEFSDRGNRIVMKYVGDDDEADEVVIFGSSKAYGFGIARVLGDDMNPQKMITLAGLMQNADVDEEQIKSVMNFFK